MSTELNPTTGIRVDVLGPTIEVLTSPNAEGNDFCTLKDVIPPSVVVLLRRHADTEDFFSKNTIRRTTYVLSLLWY